MLCMCDETKNIHQSNDERNTQRFYEYTMAVQIELNQSKDN